MNNYDIINNYLKSFTNNLNGMSLNERKIVIEGGVEALSQFAQEYNKSCNLKIKEIKVNEAVLIMWSSIMNTLYIQSEELNNKNVYSKYYQSTYDLFARYTLDERFFDVSQIKRSIAIQGEAEIDYYEDVANLFCNTATLNALNIICYYHIKDNVNEGIQYISDYLVTNYLNIQTRIGYITIKVN